MEKHEQQSEAYRKLIESSMQKYSEQLGWGLTGSQPECWVMLDRAVQHAAKYHELRQGLLETIALYKTNKTKIEKALKRLAGPFTPEVAFKKAALNTTKLSITDLKRLLRKFEIPD